MLRSRERVRPSSVPLLLLAIIGSILVKKVTTGLSPQTLQVGLLAAFLRLLALAVVNVMLLTLLVEK